MDICEDDSETKAGGGGGVAEAAACLTAEVKPGASLSEGCTGRKRVRSSSPVCAERALGGV